MKQPPKTLAMHASMLRSVIHAGLKFAACATAVLALMVFVDALDGRAAVTPAALFHGALAAWVNALPAVLLMLALLACTRRVLLSTWLALTAAALLYAISAIKFSVLASPLVPQDFYLLGQIGDDTSLFAHYLPTNAQAWFAVFGALLVIWVLVRTEPPLLGWRRRIRVPLTVVALALLVSLIAGFAPWRHVYARTTLHYRPWASATKTASRNGLLGMLIVTHLYTPKNVVGDTDPALTKALLDRHAAGIDARLGPPTRQPLPDIVIVQSESFFDPARLRGIKVTQVLPNLRRLQQHGLSGNMLVPTYGGGTIRTEFEVLTGVPMILKPQMRYPYLDIHSPVIPGLVTALKHAGYRCTAVHPNSGGFWHRDSVFRRMGFDRFISISSPLFHHAPHHGYYVDDQALTSVVLGQLQDSRPPQLMFAISMENHGPYLRLPMSDARKQQAATIHVPPTLHGDAKRALQNYLLRQSEADTQLGRLADALAKRQRPTLLVFYGDHLPGLGVSYAGGFKDGRRPDQQPVPFLLIQPGSDQPPRHRTLPAWMLSATLLQKAGIRDDRYFALLQDMAPTLSSKHWHPDDRVASELDSVTAMRLDDNMPSGEDAATVGRITPVQAVDPAPRQSRPEPRVPYIAPP